MDRILIVDDDRSIRELLSMHLEERGFGVDSAATGAEGFRIAEESPPSAIVLDMRLPDASGIDLIPELKKRAAEAPVLMITAHHDMATTILAMKAGAFDYIHKPIDIQAFDLALDRALEVRRLSRGTDYLSVEGSRPFKIDDIVGVSPGMQQLFKDVGGVRRIPIKARILAATHRELADEVKAGRFREDLYQRLKVVTLSLPPLRERPEDVPLLVEHLIVKINQRLHKNLRRVPREVIEKLQKRAWPGNVRELENVLTRAAVLSQGDILLEEHLVEKPPSRPPPGMAAPAPARDEPLATLDEIERQHIVRVWTLTRGHKGKTCQILGISRPTLERKLKKYGLDGNGD